MASQPVRRDMPYRACVGMMVLNPAGLVFIGRRRNGQERTGSTPYAWQMPQGGIDPGEMPADAAIRELYEETSMKSLSILAEAPDWFTYDIPDMVRGQAWRGRFRGQTQKWFALRFEGDDSEINITNPGGGRHRPEFEEWRWERLSALPELVVPFKRAVYEQVVDVFGGLAG